MSSFGTDKLKIMDKKLFKIAFFFGIGLAVLIHIGPLLGLYDFSEDDLISWSYMWVFPIVYGGTGWLTYDKRKAKGKPTHTIPTIVTAVALLSLYYFFLEVFPEL